LVMGGSPSTYSGGPSMRTGMAMFPLLAGARSARAQPLASDFARLILPQGSLLYLEATAKLLKMLGAFLAFFQMALEIVE
jgi:hypothetical protein